MTGYVCCCCLALIGYFRSAAEVDVAYPSGCPSCSNIGGAYPDANATRARAQYAAYIAQLKAAKRGPWVALTDAWDGSCCTETGHKARGEFMTYMGGK